MGHLDLKFLLQPGCVAAYLPSIEITLYRAVQTKSSSLKDLPDIEKRIDFGSQPNTKSNKSPTNEFLTSIHAELVCGPLDLGSYVDLSATGGTVVMTSPSMILRRGRNFYLHIRAKNLGKLEDSSSVLTSTNPPSVTPNYNISDAATSTRKKINQGLAAVLASHQEKIAMQKAKFQGIKTALKGGWGKETVMDMSDILPSFHPHFGAGPNMMSSSIIGPHKPSSCPGGGDSSSGGGGGVIGNPEDKRRDYTGCDWINEISITIRQVKPTSHRNEE